PARTEAATALDTGRDRLVTQGGALPAQGLLSDTQELTRPFDTDGDGIDDRRDDCPLTADPAQQDFDHDGVGDACDVCPGVFDPAQGDLDRDGLGDACDDDIDGDGVPNGADVCPASYVAGRPFDSILGGGGPDADGDGIPDDCDRCPHDPLNDIDGDGVCGDADNCPQSFNPAQQDRNGDGAGDACQPAIRILGIGSLNPKVLEARVDLADPDDDRLSGEIRVLPVATLPNVIDRLPQACSLAYLPDGTPGEGLVYALVAGGSPALGDVDSSVGCGDGLPDYELAMGPCGENPGGFAPILTIAAAPPQPICVRRTTTPADTRDFTVWQADPRELVLGPTARAALRVPYDRTRLTDRIDLGALPSPSAYLLQITASDGTTPEVSDTRLFYLEGETSLFIKAPRRRSASAATRHTRHSVAGPGGPSWRGRIVPGFRPSGREGVPAP
ncbi:MAG TPA: thrombospondin type 3 repeat-containing protein, partial [Candidatus Polarisedimenticolia bacterium]|nr:thrombospondin type 3 repeat-containing protein [Candidatus Polarisedimenticolia bacterium]